jgi:hypothetical protein
MEATERTAKPFANLPPYPTPTVQRSAMKPFTLMNTIHNWKYILLLMFHCHHFAYLTVCASNWQMKENDCKTVCEYADLPNAECSYLKVQTLPFILAIRN